MEPPAERSFVGSNPTPSSRSETHMRKQIYPEPTVGCFIVDEDGKILIIRSPKWKKPAIPGGHIEIGETAMQAAVREAREEVGMEVEPIRLLQVQEAIFPKGFSRKRHFIFFKYLCKPKSRKVKIDNKEIVGYEWMEMKDAARVTDEYTRGTLKMYMRGEV